MSQEANETDANYEKQEKKSQTGYSLIFIFFSSYYKYHGSGSQVCLFTIVSPVYNSVPGTD